MSCGCNGVPPAPTSETFEVRLPDGTTKTVNSEIDARIEITMAGGGTYSRR
jgi:hypothetical protein